MCLYIQCESDEKYITYKRESKLFTRVLVYINASYQKLSNIEGSMGIFTVRHGSSFQEYPGQSDSVCRMRNLPSYAVNLLMTSIP